MLYIPGFTFTVGQKTSIKSGSVLQQMNQKKRCDDIFSSGRTYKIYNIKILPNKKVLYKFLTGGEPPFIDVEFDSIDAAEARIKRLIGVI